MTKRKADAGWKNGRFDSARFGKEFEKEIRKADIEIARTADRIRREVDALFARLPFRAVAWDTVALKLADEIIWRNPELLDFLNGTDNYHPRGGASMRLAEALADWRDATWHDHLHSR
jgi:hypothetical protein